VKVTDASNTRVSLAALMAARRAHGPRLIYLMHAARGGVHEDRCKGSTEADYAQLPATASSSADPSSWSGIT
jgi:hypothetical protein